MRDTGGEGGEESFPELVSRVVDDAKDLARAEVALIRVQVAANVTRYAVAVALLGAAVTLAMAALIAGAIGGILTLSPLIGAGWATLAVVTGLILIAAILAKIGLGRLKQKFVAPVPRELE